MPEHGNPSPSVSLAACQQPLDHGIGIVPATGERLVHHGQRELQKPGWPFLGEVIGWIGKACARAKTYAIMPANGSIVQGPRPLHRRDEPIQGEAQPVLPPALRQKPELAKATKFVA